LKAKHFALFKTHFAEGSHAAKILQKSCKVEKLQSEKCKHEDLKLVFSSMLNASIE